MTFWLSNERAPLLAIQSSSSPCPMTVLLVCQRRHLPALGNEAKHRPTPLFPLLPRLFTPHFVLLLFSHPPHSLRSFRPTSWSPADCRSPYFFTSRHTFARDASDGPSGCWTFTAVARTLERYPT
ncbi:unnamed protein product [Protopolystoma xenopodis]|uniref:Uncharacterized protein n=1 Tax=Protopolystoma xenopodis TaxID=117903 RepID=A0A448WXF5_9PLAT|nr:unnamed protein product [Protopolystoma xenopodis]